MNTEHTTVETAPNGDNTIHVGVSPVLIPVIAEQAAHRGMTHHLITFPPGTTREQFYALLSEQLEFPAPAVNAPGAIDWLGSLEWFDNPIGHVVVFDGLADLLASSSGAFRVLADMLPFSSDRQRSAGHAFHAFLIGTDADLIDKALFDIDDANSTLENDTDTVNPARPTTVINHALGRGATPVGQDHEYDIAVSFSGEDRYYVERVVRAAEARGLTVFYPLDETARLWGTNVIPELRRVYGGVAARFVVPFLSRAYLAGAYPMDEFAAATAADVERGGGYILPVLLDDVKVPREKLSPDLIYISAAERTPEQLAGLLAEKVAHAIKEHQEPQDVTGVVVAALTGRLPAHQTGRLQRRVDP